MFLDWAASARIVNRVPLSDETISLRPDNLRKAFREYGEIRAIDLRKKEVRRDLAKSSLAPSQSAPSGLFSARLPSQCTVCSGYCWASERDRPA